ncbi:glycosyltransferase family 2 protein [Lentzea sp. NPDC092896]|uniref:glycosyltransferase family 2 protein n=1 Tax=Lentzea sp. NPDC092896 TaxID=3364127 RepID=UPI003815C5F9
MARVSVIIPNYNYEKTLGGCLRSVFDQTLAPHEVIVVDDASTDGSREVARRFPCTLVESGGNGGVSVARNLGVAASTGDVLFFLDSDTELSHNALETAVRILDEHPECGIVHGVIAKEPLFGDGVIEWYRSLHSHFWRRRSVGVVPTAFFALGAVRRSVFEQAGPFDETLRDSEDVEYSERLIGLCEIRLTDEYEGKHDDESSLRAVLSEQFRRSQLLSRFSAAHRLRRKAPGANSLAGVIAVTAAFGALPAALVWPFALAVSGAAVAAFAVADPKLSLFVLRQRGFGFLCAFTGIHLLVNVALVGGLVTGALKPRTKRRPAVPVAAA